MKTIPLILIGLFLATHVYGACSLTGGCPPFFSYVICDGKEYKIDDPALESCKERVKIRQEQERLKEIREAEESAKKAREEENERIRAIVKDELGYSDLVKDSQELIRENTLLKTKNAQLERENFDLGKRASVLENLIERQRSVIDLFKTLLNRLKLL